MSRKIYHLKVVSFLSFLIFLFSASFGQQPYITVWETTNTGSSANDEIAIPASGDYTYEWEGVSNPGLSGSGSASGNLIIKFPAGGIYRLSMLPDVNGKEPFHRIEFNNGGDKDKLIEIAQWGDVTWSSFENAYYGCTLLKISDSRGAPDLRQVTNMNYAFAFTPISRVPNIGQWDVSTVTNMSSLFMNATQFNDDISTWRVGNVSDMGSMFNGAAAFNQPIGFWDVTNSTNMAVMFYGATAFNQDISRWQVGNVVSMNNMFSYAENFNQRIEEWDVSKVQTMSGMFAFATSFNQNISKWNVASVQHMDDVFKGATAFNQSLGTWELSSLGTAGRLGANDISFAYSGMSCENYSRTLYEWATKSSTPSNIILDATDLQYSTDAPVIALHDYLMNFKAWNITGDAIGTCTGVVPESYVTVWKTGNNGSTNTNQIMFPAFGSFYYYYVDINDPRRNGRGKGEDATVITFPAEGTYSIAVIPHNGSTFNRIALDNEGDKNKLLEIRQWGSTIWSSLENAYYGAAYLTITATDLPNLTGVNNMANAFRETAISTVAQMNRWKTGIVTDMSGMFRGAYNFNEEIGAWDVSRVTNMSGMFWSASSFNKEIGSWNTGLVTDMSYMFAGASSFNKEIGSWNTSALMNADHMFFRATAFNQPIATWDVSKVTNMSAMFMQADAFNQPISFWDVSAVENMTDIFTDATHFNQSLAKWNLKNLVMQRGSPNGFSFANSGMECNNYSHTLFGWANNTESPSGIILNAGGLSYSPEVEATNARDLLINNLGWTINNDVAGTCVGALTKPFITVWKTDNPGVSNNNQIYFLALGQFAYTWEEVGNPSNNGSGTGNDNYTITFPNPGTYRLKMSPMGGIPFDQIMFSNGYDKDKIIDVEQWGDIAWSSFQNAFYGTSNLNISATDIPDLTQVTNMSSAFFQSGISFATNMNNWNTGNVTNMSGMFYLAPNFNELIGNWNVSKVTNMYDMFFGATDFNRAIHNWNVSSVTDMGGMFENAISFSQSIGDWDVSNVTNMANMFSGAAAFNQPIGNWDVSKVTNMGYLFYGATGFNQSIGNWDVSSVTNMEGMFEGAASFNQPLSNWDVSHVGNMTDIFKNANSFNQSLQNWNLQSLVHRPAFPNDFSFENSGLNCTYYSLFLLGQANRDNIPADIVLEATGKSLRQLKAYTDARSKLVSQEGWSVRGEVQGACETLPFVTVWDLTDYWHFIFFLAEGDYTYEWEEIDNPSNHGSGAGSGDFDLPLSAGIYRLKLTPDYSNNRPLHHFYLGHNFGYSEDGWSSYGFWSPSSLLRDVEQWGTIPWTSMYGMFTEFWKLKITATDVPDTKNVTDMTIAFAGTTMDSIPNLEYWDVSNVTSMAGLFWDNRNFNHDISNWDVSKVSDMTFIFRDARKFNQPVGKWNTSKVEQMMEAFANAFAFNQPLNNWNVSKVKNVRSMFYAAKSFNQPLSNWNIGKATNLAFMFAKAESFNQDLSNWDVSKVTSTEWMFYDATSFNQPLNNWNVSNVENMRGMFKRAASFNQPLNTWNVSGVKWMGSMFDSAYVFNQPIGNWNVSGVEELSYMFGRTGSFNQSIGNWDVSNVQYIEGMFDNAQAFNQPIGNWNMSKIERMGYMFRKTRLFNQPIVNWDVSNVKWMAGMFDSAQAFNQSLGNWNVKSVETMTAMFRNTAIFNQPLNNWDVLNVITMEGMFDSAQAFNQPINNWNVSKVQSMNYMFRNSAVFNQPLNNWDVSNVVEMKGIFNGAAAFDQSLGNWNLKNLGAEWWSDKSISLSQSGMGCDNYAQTLTGWANNPNTPSGAKLFADGIKYNLYAMSPRNHLINTLNWEITGDEFGACSVVPVRLISFTAQPENNNAKLQWTSADEQNFNGYSVERSSDANSWNEIGFVNAKANSVEKSEYTFYDRQPLLGTGYYRLKLVDRDGSFTYSEIRKVVFTGNVTISVYPNPVQNHVTVSGLTGKTVLKLTDMTGRVLQTIISNNPTERINVSGLIKGIYNLQIITEHGKVITKKIVKE